MKKKSYTEWYNDREETAVLTDINTGEVLEVMPGGNVTIQKRKYVRAGGHYYKANKQKARELAISMGKEYMALHVMASRIQPKTNAIVNSNGRKYTAVALARDLGICRQTAEKYMKAIEERGIIKTYEGRIYMNPKYFSVGVGVDERTVELFEDRAFHK